MSGLIHIFAGPSLPPSIRPSFEWAVFHGPASQGDIYSCVASRPLAIAIVDGYFERVPAVWHKEILWALREGVHVFGASSMGALRAAELADFGMIGVGRVFEDFASGRLEDDDEVTIIHADAELEYRAGSEAMVNIRATLAAAREQGILSANAALELARRAKAQFYPDRSYPALMDLAQGALGSGELDGLCTWLRRKEHRVDVKRQDACTLLRVLIDFANSSQAPMRVRWTFNHTDAWENVRRTVLARPTDTGTVVDDADREVLALVRRDPAEYERLRELALLRRLQVQMARREGFVVSERDVQAALQALRERHGLREASDWVSWIGRQGIQPSELERLMIDEASVRWYERVAAQPEPQRDMLDLLRMSGQYEGLRDTLRRGPS